MEENRDVIPVRYAQLWQLLLALITMLVMGGATYARIQDRQDFVQYQVSSLQSATAQASSANSVFQTSVQSALTEINVRLTRIDEELKAQRK